MFRNKNYLFLLLLLAICLIPVIYILRPGFPVTDDGTWLIIRFTAFFESLRSGQLPVRFILRLNDGMGYPVANFLYPLYLYLATPIHVLGFNFINSIKILLILNVFLTAIFSYLWLKKRFDALSAFVGSLVFVLAPYYLFDLFKRGSIGELLSLTIVPFILWQIERKSVVFSTIGFSFLILSHNSLSAMLIPLVLVYAFLTKANLKELFISLGLGIGMTTFFWLPALHDLTYTNFLNTKISNFYSYLFDVNDYYLVGIASILIIATGSYLVLKKKSLVNDRFLIFSITASIVIIILQLPASEILWQTFPFKDFIQFPFRILSMFVILVSYISAVIVMNINKKQKYIFTIGITIIVLIQAMYLLKTVTFEVYPDTFYSTNQSTTTVADEYFTKWFKKPNESSLDNRIVYISGSGEIENPKINSKLISFKAINEIDSEIQINVMYFPGWNAYLNDKKLNINYEKNGLIILNLPKGANILNIKFEETKIRLLADFISIFTLGVFFGISIYYLKNKYYRNIK